MVAVFLYLRAGLVLNEPALKDQCGLAGFSAPALSN